MANETVLAVDLGGTKLLVGEVDQNGTILNSKKYASGFLDQKQAMELIISSIKDYIETVGFVGEKPKRIGLGMVGQVDTKNGVWIMIDPGRKDPCNTAQILSETFGMECYIENDVKSATIAERIHGAGKGVDDFVFLNIGTGIAAGMVTGGNLIRGWQNDAGEIGHSTVDYTGNTPCVCGRYGCAEAIASGIGMNRRVKQFIGRYPDSSLKQAAESDFVRAELIFGEAEKGDALALKIAVDAADAASELILNIVRILNPQKIVLGGGVAGSDWMKRELPKRLTLPVMDSVKDGIVLSELNPDTAGLIGAAAVGFNGFD